ncbi:endochitinase CH25-like [Silene latifolia]|uniref:endochitinase CH25-like n=1 Tax=Silene latifolia TaxID=37657 RepID=UPI003D76BB35
MLVAKIVLVYTLILFLSNKTSAFQCGSQAEGALCREGLCCSKWGWCGTDENYCGESNCQSQCPPPPPPFPPAPPLFPENLSRLVTEEIFNYILMNRDNVACPARRFYTRQAFLTAAESFPEFGNTGIVPFRAKEVAAFFAHTSHATNGKAVGDEKEDYTWGYCIKKAESTNDESFCVPSTEYPCFPGKKYYGRGPFLLSYNILYGRAGEALGLDLLRFPELVELDPVVAFKTAIWFWMTSPHSPTPSCHRLPTRTWIPSSEDVSNGRFFGFGITTNIINGPSECGRGQDPRVANRIAFYQRYTNVFRTDPGFHLDCYSQRPFDHTWYPIEKPTLSSLPSTAAM